MIPNNTNFKNDYDHNAPMFIQQQGYEVVKLIELVKKTANLGGAMAEVGINEGGSAWVIRSTDKERDFHVFDTFEGLPDGSDKNAVTCNFLAKPLEVLKKTFEKQPKMFFHKGIFPQMTGRYVEDLKFSFVHIDVDLSRSILDCLGFFYYRMLSGGILLVHDYEHDPLWGKEIKKAVDTFFKDKPEELYETKYISGISKRTKEMEDLVLANHPEINKTPERVIYSTQIYMVKGKAETPLTIPNKDDPDKIDKLIDYLKRVREEGSW